MGESVKSSASIQYLGTLLSESGYISPELSRRIGMVKGDFQSLEKVWKHSALSKDRKLEIFRSLLEAKLFYSLACAVFCKADIRRLDGFQCRCLRKILKVPPSFYSRVSNAEVLRRAGHASASSLLLQRQLVLFGRVARGPDDSPCKVVSFIPGTWTPATNRYVRRVGRPRKEWIPTLLAEALRRTGGMVQLEHMIADHRQWKQYVRSL